VNNLYLKAEYRYSHFEDNDGVTDPALNGCGAGVGCDFEQENETHSIRIGAAYKFGARQEEAAPLK
jgi:opacity protein-like surface antigen